MQSLSGIPILGLGTYGRREDAGVEAMSKAIEIGYRHIDTAQTYDTEANVGEAVCRSGLPREDFFITTKVANFNLSRDLFRPSVEKSIETIGLGPSTCCSSTGLPTRMRFRSNTISGHWPKRSNEGWPGSSASRTSPSPI